MLLVLLGKHEVFEVVEEPLTAYTFDIGGSRHVDGDVGEMLIYVTPLIHRFYKSMLS
jgi:hypothetical protein